MKLNKFNQNHLKKKLQILISNILEQIHLNNDNLDHLNLEIDQNLNRSKTKLNTNNLHIILLIIPLIISIKKLKIMIIKVYSFLNKSLNNLNILLNL